MKKYTDIRRLIISVLMLATAGAHAQTADGFFGSWLKTGTSPPRMYFFRPVGERLTGVVCGPCDDARSIWEIEDGQLHKNGTATFYLRLGDNKHDAASARTKIIAVLMDNKITITEDTKMVGVLEKIF